MNESDLRLFGEGRHTRLWDVLGARPMQRNQVEGTSFAVWAPNARGVAVTGDFNDWDRDRHQLSSLGPSGVWELFVPGVMPGARYRFAVLSAGGGLSLRADPMALAGEAPPATASIVTESAYRWTDDAWLHGRSTRDVATGPLSIYEVHLGSWRRLHSEDDRPLTYRELAVRLPDHVEAMGFTHVELMPITEHPLADSWGYQVTSYYAPTARFGTPDDFRALVDSFHQREIGVILDWVPAHFPRDEWALASFDGTLLYEHADPRRGIHEQWGTLGFNYARAEVRNFLIASALYWLGEFHIDGLRVDGVSSMLYLSYGHESGDWVPQASSDWGSGAPPPGHRSQGPDDAFPASPEPHGVADDAPPSPVSRPAEVAGTLPASAAGPVTMLGRRVHEEAVGFIRELNATVHQIHPDVVLIAEESTAWPGVSRPAGAGGLDFGLKWNMGWMHDTLAYFSQDPIERPAHHHQLTFGLLYAFTENFVLPLSHDEVVHGKGSLLGRMPGDWLQRLAGLRALYAWMWAHPGKQLLFMGGEMAQQEEWDHRIGLDWHLLQHREHRGVQRLVAELNRCYRQEPALWEQDPVAEGFSWIEADDARHSVLSFLRLSADGRRALACIANFSAEARNGYRVGLPANGSWEHLLNSDETRFGGRGGTSTDAVWADGPPWQGLAYSGTLDLAPFSVVWLAASA
ncbi:MAG: 1,4-alpha-glucan-branching protein [Candidatus Dormibacteria bacterium]